MKIQLIIAFCLLSLSAQAQMLVKDKITINGLVVGDTYTEQELIKVLGQPTKIDQPKITDAYENSYTYHYGKDRFYLIDGEFYGGDLNGPSYIVNGAIRVGDSISKVDLLGGIKEKHTDRSGRQSVEWRPSYEGLYSCTYVSFSYDKNNVITFIYAMIQNL